MFLEGLADSRTSQLTRELGFCFSGVDSAAAAAAALANTPLWIVAA